LKVWLNGEIREEGEACIAPADRGFLLGDGVFETLRSHAGRLPTLDEHLDRLAASARALGIAPPPLAELGRGARELMAANDIADARVRITLTSGSGPPGLVRGAARPTALITVAPLPERPPVATAVVVPWVHDERRPLAGVKTTSRAESVVALTYARERGADEALFLNTAGNVCEATTANVFCVRDGRVLTPPLEAGCLAGITREHVLHLCSELALESAEEDVRAAELEQADEIFLTSSTREVQPLVELDGQPVGAGRPGRLTRRLAEAFSELARDAG
jgi:branched-chain amino acid aminotransferase